MDLLSTLLLLALFITDSASHLCLKGASRSVASASGAHYWRLLLSNPFLWMGLASSVVDFFLWMAFLSRVPLGQGVLAASITIVGVMLGGRLLFREHITNARVIAITLIALGVALIGWGQT